MIFLGGILDLYNIFWETLNELKKQVNPAFTTIEVACESFRTNALKFSP